MYDEFKRLPFFITDFEKKLQISYFKIELDELDCTTTENINKIEDIEVYKDKIKGNIFLK